MGQRKKGGHKPTHDDTYRVGPGRPPREHQFKTGQSGNPAGRPRGALNRRTLRTLAAQVFLEGKVTVKENGHPRQVSRFERLLMVLDSMGTERDLGALKAALQLVERMADGGDAGPATVETPEADTAILRRFGFGGAARADAVGNEDADEGDQEETDAP